MSVFGLREKEEQQITSCVKRTIIEASYNLKASQAVSKLDLLEKRLDSLERHLKVEYVEQKQPEHNKVKK